MAIRYTSIKYSGLFDMIYFSRLEKFIRGVYSTSEDSIRLSDKLFNDEKYRNSNAIRVLEIIGQIDAEEKLDFIIAATRCLLCGNIVFSYNNGN